MAFVTVPHFSYEIGSPCGKQIQYPDFSCQKNPDGSWSCKEKPYMVLNLEKNTWTIKVEEYVC